MSTFIRRFLALGCAGVSLFMFFVYITRQFFMPASTMHLSMSIIAGASLLGALAWMRWGGKQERPALMHSLLLVTRFFLAYMFFFYALAKVFKLQFGAPPEILKQPAGELDGFWKAWVFFGHSQAYGLMIAISQMIAALLLLFRRTLTTGLLIYLFLLGNILALTFSYNVVAMQELSVVLVLMCLFLLSFDIQRVWRFLTGEPAGGTLMPEVPRTYGRISFACIAVLLGACVTIDGFFYYRIAQQAGS